MDDVFEALGDAYDRIIARAEAGGALPGISTGFTDLDDMTGGLIAGEVTVVAGRPSMGKTAFALNVAEHVAIRAKQPVVLISTEMDRETVVQRMMCSIGKVSLERVRQGTPNDADYPLMVDAAGKIGSTNKRFGIVDNRRLSLDELSQTIEDADTPPALLIIDSLQTLRPSRDLMNADAHVRLDAAMHELRALAQEHNMAVLATSQLNRLGGSRPYPAPAADCPVLNDLPSPLDQHVDAALLLHRPEFYDRSNPELTGLAELHLAKHRNGALGMANLGFLARYTKFTNLARRHEPLLPSSPALTVVPDGGG